jgi:hypothetical protein
MQRSLADEIACEKKPLRCTIPQHESEIADQPRYRALAPTVESLEQDGRIAKLTTFYRRQVEFRYQIVPIIEPNVGNKRKPTVAAVQRLTVINVFRKSTKKSSARGERAVTPLADVVRPIRLLCRQHTSAIVVRTWLAVKPPNSSKCAHLLPSGISSKPGNILRQRPGGTAIGGWRCDGADQSIELK